MMLLLLWSVGTLSMYMHAKHTMQSRGRTAVDGEHKAIINLAIAMNQELSLDPLPTKTEDEIKKLVRDAHGGSISYSTSIPFEHQSKRRRFMERIRNRKWFLAWIAVKLVILGLFLFYIPAIGLCLMYALPGSIIADFVVLLVCTTSGSLIVLTSVPTFVSFVVATFPIYMVEQWQMVQHSKITKENESFWLEDVGILLNLVNLLCLCVIL